MTFAERYTQYNVTYTSGFSGNVETLNTQVYIHNGETEIKKAIAKQLRISSGSRNMKIAVKDFTRANN